MTNNVILGNSLEVLPEFPDNTFDGVITDPPYGLGDPPDAMEMLRAWMDEGEYHGATGGFMSGAGVEWDAIVRGPAYWKEVYRVLKPGAHALVFSGSRTLDLQALALRIAGFHMRDIIMWVYGQGSNKGLNLDRAIRRYKGEEFEEVAQRFKGYNTTVRPAYEPVLVCMKPPENNFIDNAIDYGIAGFWIDGARVKSGDLPTETRRGNAKNVYQFSVDNWGVGYPYTPSELGRWPSNFVFSHTEDCVMVGIDEVIDKEKYIVNSSSNEEGHEELEIWHCPPHCPVRQLNEQAGISSSSKNYSQPVKEDRHGFALQYNTGSGEWFGNMSSSYSDSGGRSRFFYCAKASTKERNFGCEDMYWRRLPDGFVPISKEEWEELPPNKRADGNVHRTVKPIDVGRWLARLIRPPMESPKVLDPFCGSASLGIAAIMEGWETTNIELEENSFLIAKNRILWAEEQMKPSPQLQMDLGI